MTLVKRKAESVFTDGVFLSPKEINGLWYWVVTEFTWDAMQLEAGTENDLDLNVIGSSKDSLFNTMEDID